MKNKMHSGICLCCPPMDWQPFQDAFGWVQTPLTAQE